MPLKSAAQFLPALYQRTKMSIFSDGVKSEKRVYNRYKSTQGGLFGNLEIPRVGI